MAQLVDLAKFKAAIGETSAANDSIHTEAIEDASAAILNAYDRDFASAQVTEDRDYKYDGGGVLEIDDAEAINSVTYLPASTPLTTSLWIARREGPASVTVYSYLELPPFTRPSGAMGFTQNLDIYLQRHPSFREIDVRINADWGWPTVPDDVQRATIWTAAHFEAQSRTATQSQGLASKSVAEVAEAYIQDQESRQQAAADAIPPRAVALLERYRRHVL